MLLNVMFVFVMWLLLYSREYTPLQRNMFGDSNGEMKRKQRKHQLANDIKMQAKKKKKKKKIIIDRFATAYSAVM